MRKEKSTKHLISVKYISCVFDGCERKTYDMRQEAGAEMLVCWGPFLIKFQTSLVKAPKVVFFVGAKHGISGKHTIFVCSFFGPLPFSQSPVKTIFIAGACFDFVKYRTRAYQSANWIRSETTVAADISKMPCKPFRAPFSTPCLRLYCIPAGRPAERACAVVNDRTL